VRVRFAEFTLDSETRQLFHGGREVHLSPKAFDLLRTLLERRPKVVDKTELHAEIWPGTFVVDANLNVLIAEIRRALADRPHNPRFVRTIHGIGYAWCAEATDLEPAPSERSSPGSTRFWLMWNERAIVLAEGDNLIGRDPQCQVWLDASGVSRRHASVRIRGAGDTVVLKDLGSTNGTFLRSSRVTSQEPLTDGDVIQIGSVELKFRVWSPDKSSETERIRS